MIGTQDAAIGEFPWIARLGYYDTEIDSGTSFACIGSVISEFFIITSASCAVGSEVLGRYVELARLGDYNLETDVDCVHNSCADPHVDYQINKISSHVDYLEKTRQNNIALVKTADKIKFTDFIQPICLLIAKTKDFSEKLYIGEKASIAGWGMWSLEWMGGIRNTILQKGDVVVKDPSECWNCQDPMENLTRGELCAGSKASPCDDSDSGAPLMVQELDPQRWHLLGFYSCGNCKTADNVFTRLADYSLWMLDHM